MKPFTANGIAPINYSTEVSDSWLSRFGAQYWGLFWYKAARVAYRNLLATVLRVIIAPFLFMLLSFIVVKGIDASPQNRASNAVLHSRSFETVSPIPDCTTDLYYSSKQTCWDLLFTPNTSDIQDIVRSIQANNPGRPIPDSRVLGFASRQDSNNFLLADLQRRVNGGLHFAVNGSTVSFTLQTNSTVRSFKGQYQDPTFWAAVPLQVATERELSRRNFGLAGRQLAASDWEVETAGFPHPSLAKVSLAGQILGPFLFASNMFGFVLVISAVVGERELKLRQAMRSMGLLDSAYWLSWASYEVVMAAATSLLICAFGSLFQFNLFYDNSFALPLLVFFLFQLAMSSFAFLASVWVKTSSTAVNLGFVIFLVGWIMQLVEAFGFPYSPDYFQNDRWAAVVFALFPWSLLAKCVKDLGNAVIPGNPGISWQNRNSYCQNLSQSQIATQPATPGQYRDFQCVLPVGTALGILVAEWLVYLLLAVYLDNILPNESGARRPFWYIFLPNYWRPTRRRNLRHRPGMVQTSAGAQLLKPPLQHAQLTANQDEDVALEQAKMEELLQHRSVQPGTLAAKGEGLDQHSVELFGLQKVFPGTSRMRKWFCCGRGVKPDFWAMKGSWLAMPQGQLFCLLGPNGAGKTTTINVLTGIIPATGGDALVNGHALSSPGGVDRIRKTMGVCPQFDILWGELTGREHLIIYGNIKGLGRKAVARQTEELLARVKLSEAANVRTSAYSGGMRRRLSVAIALLGEPAIVFLDEPTTGMDPISRRHVWDIIQAAKPGRAIVLTTHSMEEADVLGDRIAIMAKGSLRCIGSSLHLKNRFGAGYQLSLSTLPLGHSPDSSALDLPQAAATAFVRDRLGLEPTDSFRTYVQFRVPRALEDCLPGFLEELQARRLALGVTDVQISLTSLEEVFLNIARKAEQEAAEAAGNTKQKVFIADGTQLEVELGADTATHAQTGEVYRVRWAQDDAGALQVLDAVPVSEKKV